MYTLFFLRPKITVDTLVCNVVYVRASVRSSKVNHRAKENGEKTEIKKQARRGCLM